MVLWAFDLMTYRGRSDEKLIRGPGKLRCPAAASKARNASEVTSGGHRTIFAKSTPTTCRLRWPAILVNFVSRRVSFVKREHAKPLIARTRFRNGTEEMLVKRRQPKLDAYAFSR